MSWYVIVETDDGLSVASVAEGGTAEETAVRLGGVIVDPGPYSDYEQAYDAMLEFPDAEDED
ncbi:MAG: hypothetical protein GXY25_14720 [Pirellulaceae bacterium]|jgi:hypothetical protein|nr:hypothetical protein [Thermoguttaceae bacterium]MDI9444048.1 hypothetical protein [Planctomycetota bacterium]NLZ01777.1 hypothetical protein [Pirellulaceae bacterium]